MGKDAGSAPQAPDPTKIIPIQSAADRAAFNYQTNANRYNTVGPDQTQNWSMTPQFDENAYNQALQDWQGHNSQGTFVPGSPGGQAHWNPDTQSLDTMPATSGYWTGGTSDGSAAPKREDFTNNRYTLTTTLSPEAQALHDAQSGAKTSQAQIAQALLSKLGGSLGSEFDVSSAPALASNFGNPQDFNQSAADAVYRQATRYLDPQVEQQQKALEARLAEQGFVPGTPGYTQAMQTFMDTNNRQYAQARDTATTQGFQVGHQQFADTLAGGQQQNQSRSQAIAELLQKRQVPQSDLNTMLSYMFGGGNPTNAGSAQVPQGGVGALQTPDQLAAYNQQYQDLLGKYNADVASNNNTTSTIGSLVGAIAIAF